MNDLAREILIHAALKGRRQIRGWLHDTTDGVCAIGLLLEHLGQRNQLPPHPACFVNCDRDPRFPHYNWATFPDMWRILQDVYDINGNEIAEVTARNNEGWDFLTIARKCGVPHHTQEA